jgi:DNA-binding transcriptional regulator LsrR (DeoR family)
VICQVRPKIRTYFFRSSYLKVSRSTVSRLLTYAREVGVVEVRVRETADHVSGLTADLVARYPQVRFQVLGVRQAATGGRINTTIAQYGAHAVAAMVEPGMTIGIAWGKHRQQRHRLPAAPGRFTTSAWSS